VTKAAIAVTIPNSHIERIALVTLFILCLFPS
jgi:hypothetical protein